MIAVIDTGCLIDRDISAKNVTRGYVTESVLQEARSKNARECLDFFSFLIEVRNPAEEHLKRVKEDLAKRVHNLSETDMDVIALTLELKEEISDMWIGPDSPSQVDVCCLTTDNGIKNELLRYNSYEDTAFSVRTFRIRCYSCCTLFNETMDFCRKCGHSTLTRVSVGETEDGERVFLKKNYNYRPRVYRDNKGVELRSSDQREYVEYQRMLSRKKKSGRGLLFE